MKIIANKNFKIDRKCIHFTADKCIWENDNGDI